MRKIKKPIIKVPIVPFGIGLVPNLPDED